VVVSAVNLLSFYEPESILGLVNEDRSQAAEPRRADAGPVGVRRERGPFVPRVEAVMTKRRMDAVPRIHPPHDRLRRAAVR
jgi:hypothetical protein